MILPLLVAALAPQDTVETVWKSLQGATFTCEDTLVSTLQGLGPKKELVEALAKAVEDPGANAEEFPRKVLNGFHALAHLKTAEAAAALLRETGCRTPSHSEYAWGYLGHVDRPEVRAALLAELARARPPYDDPRLAAVIDSLAELRESKSLPGLLKVLDGEHFLMLEHVAKALGILGNAGTGEVLARKIRDARWVGALNYEDATAALHVAAARLGRKELEPEIEKMLSSGTSSVAETASGYFLSQGDLKGAVHYLRALRESEDRAYSLAQYSSLRAFIPGLPSPKDGAIELSVEEGRKAAGWIEENRSKFVFNRQRGQYLLP